MKLFLSILLFFKRFGFILRGLGIALCCGLIFYEALPDLIFNLKVGKAQTYTEEQILNTKNTELPLYLKITDVGAIGEMYVTEMRQKKNQEPTLSAIIYPVYNLNTDYADIEELMNTPCNIVVKENSNNIGSIDTYFDELKLIEGKFDQKLIDSETRKLLTEGGYNISENCIMIEKGVSIWSSSKCIIIILVFGLVGALILLSFLPASILNKIFKQEERFVKVE